MLDKTYYQEMSPESSLATLAKLSYAMVACSFLQEINFLRSFPSYNLVIAALAFFLYQTAHSFEEDHKPSITQITLIGCFCTLTMLSLVIDLVFCVIWGGDVIGGDSVSVKFSFFCFIINMFLKLGALLYATSAQIVLCKEYDAVTAPTAKRGNADKGNTLETARDLEAEGKKQEDDDLSEESEDYNNHDGVEDVMTTPRNNLNLDVPFPPFTPGISGLVSPYPRKMNHGVTPPKPPMRK